MNNARNILKEQNLPVIIFPISRIYPRETNSDLFDSGIAKTACENAKVSPGQLKPPGPSDGGHKSPSPLSKSANGALLSCHSASLLPKDQSVLCISMPPRANDDFEFILGDFKGCQLPSRFLFNCFFINERFASFPLLELLWKL